METPCALRFLASANISLTWPASWMRSCQKRFLSFTRGSPPGESGCLHHVGNCAPNRSPHFGECPPLCGLKRVLAPCASRTSSTCSGLDVHCTQGLMRAYVPYLA